MRMMVKTWMCTLTLFFLWSNFAEAGIVNVLSDVGQNENGFSGEVTVSGNYKKGNKNLQQVSGGSVVTYRSEEHVVSLIL